MNLEKDAIMEDELLKACKAFLDKWPEVEKEVDNIIITQFARGYAYKGPNLGKVLRQLREAVKRAEHNVRPTTRR